MKYLIALRNALKDVSVFIEAKKERDDCGFSLLGVSFFDVTFRAVYPIEIWILNCYILIGVEWTDVAPKCLSWIWSELKLDLRGVR